MTITSDDVAVTVELYRALDEITFSDDLDEQQLASCRAMLPRRLRELASKLETGAI